MGRLVAVAMLSWGCTAADTTGDSEGSEPQACAPYLDCLSEVDSVAYAEVVGSYGADGSCWSGSDDGAAQCADACATGLAQLKDGLAEQPLPSACVSYAVFEPGRWTGEATFADSTCNITTEELWEILDDGIDLLVEGDGDQSLDLPELGIVEEDVMCTVTGSDFVCTGIEISPFELAGTFLTPVSLQATHTTFGGGGCEITYSYEATR